MYKNITSVVIVGVATVLATAQTPQQSVDRSTVPWAVTIVHTIELSRVVARWQQQQPNVRVGMPPSAPSQVYNVTTGVVIDGDGHVLTRLAYLDASDRQQQKLSVTASDGSSRPARLVGVDYATGFAVLAVPGLKAEKPQVAAAAPASSNVRILTADLAQRTAAHRPGRYYLAPSFAESQGQVLSEGLYAKTQGTLTLISESFRSRCDSSIVTTFKNEVIGLAQWAGFGRAYVFPFAYLRDKVAKRVLEKNSDVPAGWLGIIGESLIPQQSSTSPGAGAKRGVLIREVAEQSPAASAGIQPGDLIVGLDGFDVSTTADLGAILSSLPAGSEVSIRALRNQGDVAFKVVLGAKPAPPFTAQQFILPQNQGADSQMTEIKHRVDELSATYKATSRLPVSPERSEVLRELETELRFLYDSLRALTPGGPDSGIKAQPRTEEARSFPPAFLDDTPGLDSEARAHIPFGFWVRELKPQLAAQFSVRGGILVDAVDESSKAELAGLRAGDVIIGIGERALFSVDQFQAAIASSGSPVELRIVRNKQTVSIALNH